MIQRYAEGVADAGAFAPEHIAAASNEIGRRAEQHHVEAAARYNELRRQRRGRPQTVKTRAKLASATRRNAAQAALADESTSALRRERIARGFTLPDLAIRSGLGRTTVWTAELRPHTITTRSWQRLSFALFGDPGHVDKIRPARTD